MTSAHPAVEDGIRGPRLLVGLGTGRCGTLSLARLLDAQPECCAHHEYFEYNLGVEPSPEHVAELARLARATAPRVFADVHLVYLWHVPALLALDLDVRFLCLRREREATVQSFLRKVGPRHHWYAHDGRRFLADAWDRCFPKYGEPDRAAALGRYWDDYYQRAEAFARDRPERFAIFPVAALNSAAGQAAILDFAGLPREGRVLSPGIRENTSP